MDFDLSGDQQAVLDGLGRLLKGRAGPARARAFHGRHDVELDDELARAGWYSLIDSSSSGPLLDAALVLELVSRELANVSAIGKCLVAPALGIDPGEGAIALIDGAGVGRWAAEADQALQSDGKRVFLCALDRRRALPVVSPYGFPMGRALVTGRQEVAGVTGDRFRAVWRLGVAVECCGLMQGALDLLLPYLRDRKQFGRSLLEYQALRHRVAEVWVLAESARLLSYETAWGGSDPQACAVAATLACLAAKRVVRESHQMTGAIGLTRDYDLHLWTLRLHAVSMEMGGRRAHAKAAAFARWPELTKTEEASRA